MRALDDWRSLASAHRLDGSTPSPGLSFAEVELARNWLRLGAATGEDQIPAEVLLLLDSLWVQTVWSAFDSRMRGLAEWQK